MPEGKRRPGRVPLGAAQPPGSCFISDRYVCLETAVTTSVLDRLRQLRREPREYPGEAHKQVWLQETAPHIPLVKAMASQNFREIDELLRAGPSIDPSDRELANAVQRSLETRAPFTWDKNSVADALLIEIYGTQASEFTPHRAGRPAAQIAGREARHAGIRPLSSSLSDWCCYRAVPQPDRVVSNIRSSKLEPLVYSPMAAQ
jgi:hypothetical protein